MKTLFSVMLGLSLSAFSPSASSEPQPDSAPLAGSGDGTSRPGDKTDGDKIDGEKAKQPAPAAIKTEVLVLLATNEGKGIDAKLGDLPELKKPPFSAYDTYKLLEKNEQTLDKGKLKESKLPDGGKLQVTYTDVVHGDKDDAPKFVLSTAIHKPDGKVFLPGLDVNAQKGKYFFVAGQRFKAGILVLGIRVVSP